MTHATVTVLVPKDGSMTLDQMMAPYDEAITVPPYQVECYCVSYNARVAAKKHTEELLGYVLHRHNTAETAVFIQDYRLLQLILLEQEKHIVQMHLLRDENRLSED